MSGENARRQRFDAMWFVIGIDAGIAVMGLVILAVNGLL